jgi:predicted DNA-binding transcriptional regulator AlpA
MQIKDTMYETDMDATQVRFTATGIGPVLLDKQALATLLGCSIVGLNVRVRTGQVPKPVKIGKHVRWPLKVIERWIDAGCPRSAVATRTAQPK